MIGDPEFRVRPWITCMSLQPWIKFCKRLFSGVFHRRERILKGLQENLQLERKKIIFFNLSLVHSFSSFLEHSRQWLEVQRDQHKKQESQKDFEIPIFKIDGVSITKLTNHCSQKSVVFSVIFTVLPTFGLCVPALGRQNLFRCNLWVANNQKWRTTGLNIGYNRWFSTVVPSHGKL